MAILAAFFALGSKFAGKIISTALGWSSTLLFGRVPADRQVVILGITFGSMIWIVLLIGVLVPEVGTFLLLFIPPQGFVPETVIRVIMLVAALILPAIVGAATLLLDGAAKRDLGGLPGAIARGYPSTPLLAVLLLFLSVLAVQRKVTSLVRRRTDAHVPIVVFAGAYDRVARDLDDAISASGIEVTAGPAPSSMSTPARGLTSVAGRDGASLVPDKRVQLKGPEIDILVYPMDLLISGRKEIVARARAVMASRLTTTAAHMTTSAESQAIEDRVGALIRPRADAPEEIRTFDARAAAELDSIDRALASVPIPYEEWEILYRQRLQVERDLRARAMDEAVVRPEDDVGGRPSIHPVRALRAGAAAIVDALGSDDAAEVLDDAVGSTARNAIQTAAAAAGVVGHSIGTGGEDRPEGAGEPLSDPTPPDR